MATTRRSTADPIDWRATFIEALNAPGALGDTYTRFYHYSFLNQIRLMMQGVFEPVATYKRWEELGRKVVSGKGSGKAVLAPTMVIKRDPETKQPVLDKNGKPVRIVVGFHETRTVFGYSDTAGADLPPAPAPSTWDAATALAALSVTQVPFEMLNGNVQGYSFEDDKGRQLAINPVAKYPAKTMLHELAHIILGHTKVLVDGEGHGHRGIMEFEAESVAYLVAKELEFDSGTWDSSESRAYIQHWLDGTGLSADERDEITDKSMNRVFSAANKILVAGRAAKAVAAQVAA